MRGYLDHEGFSTSGYLDEPATAQALAGFLLRGVDCGAVDAERVGGVTGIAELRGLAARRFG